jgi:hypothetical protein
MRTRSAVLLAGGVGYSFIAASTTPFTLPADILTGTAIVGLALLVCVRWPLRTRAARSAAATPTPTAGGSGHPFGPWVGLFVAFVVWELFDYLAHGSRSEHPTFSSITDAIDRTYLLKVLMFLGWLAFGWVIVRRGSRATTEPVEPVGP